MMDSFLQRIRQRRLRIGVVGDAMIDEAYQVSVDRISPEFPIPVVVSAAVEPYCEPGGAANVARQMLHFNVDVDLCSVIDSYAAEIFEKHGLNVEHCVLLDRDRIPVKRRFYDGNFPIFRWDVEKSFEEREAVDRLFDRSFPLRPFSRQMLRRKHDAIIFSDYAKGLFSDDLWQFAVANDIPTIVDPKHGPLDKWKGCTVFKPNALEARRLSGFSDWKSQAEFFAEKVQCRAVVITRGGQPPAGCYVDDGLVWFEADVAGNSNAPASLVGAGDCFAAFLAMALGHGFDVPSASALAYRAGAVYVSRERNIPLTPEDLEPKRATILADDGTEVTGLLVENSDE